MNLVTIEKLTKEFGDRPLLEEVDLLINAGDRIGLIGINGSGKTTLLRVIAGLEEPDSGNLTIWGGVRIAYLPQDPHLPEEQTVLENLFAGDLPKLRLLREYQLASLRLQRDPDDERWQNSLADLVDQMDREGAWTAEGDARAILSRLGIFDVEKPVGELSGGQGKRVALARALMAQADLLILDEPTNHIDAEALDWLEEHLATMSGALLMVTHDRYFLSRVVNRIVELDRRQLVSYPGNYQRYLELRTSRDERLAASERKRQNLLRRELEWLRRGAMARSTKQKARKTRIEELQQLRLDRGDEQVAMELAGRRLGKKVLEAKGLSKRFDDLQLFQDADFSLAQGDRIGLVGPNGVGKSTLLDILAGVQAPDEGSVIWGSTVHLAYYDQLSRGLKESQRVIDFIEDKAPLIRTQDGRRVDAARMLEWFLFPRPQQQSLIGSLSGGEKRRLYLLWVLVHRPNVLFLDEPTNDLDLPTLAVLEQFLDHFQGCLIVVSHDRYFLDRNVDYLATFEGDSLSSRYPAPYSAFQRRRKEQDAGDAVKEGERKQVETSQTDAPRQKKRTLTWKEAREFEELESRLAEIEEEKRAVEVEINEAGGDFARLRALVARLEGLEKELAKREERWLELANVGD